MVEGRNRVVGMRPHLGIPIGRLAFVGICLWLTRLVSAGELATPILYRIEAGNYTIVGGFAGTVTVPLPNGSQAYVELTTGTTSGTAALRILGTNEAVVFLSLSGGLVSGNQITFRGTIPTPGFPLVDGQAEVAYVVAYTANSLSLNGTIASRVPCCDLPSSFRHDGVQAFRRPDLFTSLLPSINFGLSTNRVFSGDRVEVQWSGYNNGTACLLDFGPCPERFGPARGPWQDAVSLVNGTNRWLLGTLEFNGVLPVGGGYRSAGSFQIPDELAPGIYGIEIQIDHRFGTTNGIVLEQNEGNNTARRAGLITVLPRLSIQEVARMADGSLRLRIQAAVTGPFRLQARSAWSPGEWTDKATFTGGSGPHEWVDREVSAPARFYRVVAP